MLPVGATWTAAGIVAINFAITKLTALATGNLIVWLGLVEPMVEAFA